MNNELRSLTAEAIVVELLGENWRADRPLETMGGLIGHVVQGLPTHELYREKVGEIRAYKRALEIMDQSVKRMNEV